MVTMERLFGHMDMCKISSSRTSRTNIEEEAAGASVVEGLLVTMMFCTHPESRHYQEIFLHFERLIEN